MTISTPDFTDKLATKLLERALIEQSDVKRAAALQSSSGLPLDRALLKLGLVSEEDLLPVLCEALALPYVDQVSDTKIDDDRHFHLGVDYCATNQIVFAQMMDGHSALLTADPTNEALLREIEFHLEQDFSVAVASTRFIRSLLTSATAKSNSTAESTSEDRLKQDQEIVRQHGIDGPIIRFVSEAIDEAVALGASDIHFETQDQQLRMRYRLAGLLKPQPVNRSLNPTSIMARLKVMAGMNVSERRLPQDGRITSNIAGRQVDFRVSSVPTSFGESIVARVLDPGALRLGWEKLGFEDSLAQQITDIIEQPSGLFLVTGPTGSGKTTTLYTALSHLNRDDRKILTVEDPVEYNLPGIDQVQVHDEIGMSFAKALRAFLRQDPNIIMIGEIRDEETAEIACRAALVGRMVLSTLHTNSPEGALVRLTDLGVPEYIVRDVLRGVLGQDLEIAEGGRRLKARLVV